MVPFWWVGLFDLCFPERSNQSYYYAADPTKTNLSFRWIAADMIPILMGRLKQRLAIKSQRARTTGEKSKGDHVRHQDISEVCGVRHTAKKFSFAPI
jgi:hypothetical protein